MDKKIEKDIIKCSRCGLCMDVCPVYKVKKSETSVLRGKFLQLLGIIRGELKYDKKIAYNLDLCTGCKKCVKACPSGINAVEIFASIKSSYQSPFEKLYYSAPFFKLKIFCLQILGKLTSLFKFKKKVPVLNNVVHFKGCVSKALSPKGDGFEIKDGKFACCALPYYTKGRLDLYEKYKKRNIELIKKYEKVVFDCATCYDTVLNYEELSAEEKNKLVYFTDFYKNEPLFSKSKKTVTFHKPCHLSDEKFEEIESILKSVQNVSYVRMENYDECCGFAGDFFTRHIKTAAKLADEKIKNVIKTNADIVITTCPTCLWSLKYATKKLDVKLKVYDLKEFLSNLEKA